MKAEFTLNLKKWSLIPTIGVRTRRDYIVISWLCASLWLDDTSVNYWSAGKYISVGLYHNPTSLSLPNIEINFKGKSIHLQILGFSMLIYFHFLEDEDLPF